MAHPLCLFKDSSMMRWLLLASLMFSCNLLAANGSFSITSGNAADIAFTRMNGSTTTTNYATGTTGRIGTFSSVEDRWCLRFEGLNDSMIARDGTYDITSWDSARIWLTSTAALTSGDSLTIAMHELKSTRAFGESYATWVKYGVGSDWTTAGASSTTSDIEATLLDTSATMVVGTTGGGGTSSYKVPGADVADTLNNAGVTFRQYRIGVDDGTTSAFTIATDDNATTGYRPKITVYYTYTPSAAPTVGTGRFGRSQTGEYLNVR